MDSHKLIEDPTEEEGFNGMILGSPDMKSERTTIAFDLHAADKHIREHGLSVIDENIIKMFAYKST